MRSGEVTLAIFVDFSKAIDILIKLHSLHFSKNFLNFAQIHAVYTFYIQNLVYHKGQFEDQYYLIYASLI